MRVSGTTGNYRLGKFLPNLAAGGVGNLQTSLIGIFMLGLLTYGATFFSFGYNHDGLIRIFEIDVAFREAVSIGRWMYALVAKLLFSTIRLPMLHGLFTVTILCVIVALLWEIFDIRTFLARIVTGGIFISLPMFVHYFYYTGDSEVYSVGMLFVTISLWRFVKGGIWNTLIAILLIVLALGCYPALLAFMSSLYIGYVLVDFLRNGQRKQNVLLLARSIGICIAGLLLYYAITKLLIVVMGMELTDYKDAQLITPYAILIRLPFKVVHTFAVFAQFVERGSFWLKLSLLTAVIGCLSHTFREKRFRVGSACYLICLLIIFMIASLSIYLVTFELWLYSGFAFGLLTFIAILVLPGLWTKSVYLRNFQAVLYGIFILTNVVANNLIIEKYKLKVESGNRIVADIARSILSHEGFNKDETSIAAVGDLRNNSNYALYDPFPEISVLNALTTTPLGLAETNQATKLMNQLKLFGLEVHFLELEEAQKFEHLAIDHQMPDFPENGSIVQVDETLVLNLGFYEPSFTIIGPRRLTKYEQLREWAKKMLRMQ